ncbi:MAG: ATP-binding cassette domain-containing protein [Pseudomonadota bacterium]
MRDHAGNGRAGIEAGAAQLPCRVDGLTLEVDGKQLLQGIDLTLAHRGITVLMGPNGAGKSLLLKALHGLVEPTAGRVAWGGAPVSAATRRAQALVFQKPVLLRRSVAANIDFVLKARGRRDAGRRTALLTHVGLADRAGQPARALSGGEQQRLALARALATEPAVLLLDEPTASLDPASTALIEDIVRAARADGMKIVFVTHDIGQARRLADEIVFLHEGRLAEHTPAARFFEAPASTAARAYLAGRLHF